MFAGDEVWWVGTGASCGQGDLLQSNGGVLDAGLRVSVRLDAGTYELCMRQSEGSVVKRPYHSAGGVSFATSTFTVATFATSAFIAFTIITFTLNTSTFTASASTVAHAGVAAVAPSAPREATAVSSSCRDRQLYNDAGRQR